MSMFLTVVATMVFILLWPVLANIYEGNPSSTYAARWAIALWVLTLDAVLFAAALWTGGYLN